MNFHKLETKNEIEFKFEVIYSSLGDFFYLLQACQGKVHNHAHTQTPKIHFRCAVIANLEHSYSPPIFWAKKI